MNEPSPPPLFKINLEGTVTGGGGERQRDLPSLAQSPDVFKGQAWAMAE